MTTTRWPPGRARLTDPRVVDAVLVLGCLVLTAFAVKAHWSGLPRPAIAAAGLVGGTAQWWRRRWPLVAAVAGALAYALSGNPGPVLVGLYSAASYGSWWVLGVAAGVGWAGFAGWSWIDQHRLYANDAVSAAVIVALVLAVGVYAATRRQLTASWRERAERAEAERQLREDQARATERTRIAREMHDVLAHKVSLIALHAGALELNAGAGPERVRQGAELIRVTAREALQELRYVLGVLRAGPPPPRGEPFADLSQLVAAATAAGQQVELNDDAGALPPATARAVYRVVQEGLTNARKHAPGATALVSVTREDTAVIVTVTNPSAAGTAMDLPGSGAGLVGLAERIRLAGGTIHSGAYGGGWRLRAEVPWLDHSLDLDAATAVTSAEAP